MSTADWLIPALAASFGALVGGLVVLLLTSRRKTASGESPGNSPALARLEDRIEKSEKMAARRFVHTEALFNIYSVLQVQAPLPAFEGSRVAPDCAKILLNCMFDRRPALMVEFGGGVSTLVCAYAMKKLGRGRIISIEHDPSYTPALRGNIRRHGLEQIVTVVEAPLEPLVPGQFVGPGGAPDPQGGPPHRWYRREAWVAALAGLGITDQPGTPKIDFVFVDGPGGGTDEPLSRWPAIPSIIPFMAANAMVVLDDANRPGETECLRIWTADFPDLKADPVVKTSKGTAIIRRQHDASM